MKVLDTEYILLKECLRVIIEPCLITNLLGEKVLANAPATLLIDEIKNNVDDYEGFSSDADNNILVELSKITPSLKKSITWELKKINNRRYTVSSHIIKLTNTSLCWLNFSPVMEASPEKEERRIDEVTNAFLANISHEIRTPLNGIIGFSELLVKKNIAPDKQKEYANIIYSNGTHLLKLVSDLLDLSRLEAGKIILYKTQFSLNRLLYDLQLFFLLDMKNRNKGHISFRVVPGLPDGPDLIIADEMRLKQVIINLVANAIKFTSKGEICLKYKIVAENMLEFCVSDTGRGMDSNELKLVFDRFQQANDSIAKEFGGTGLGLAISKEFVEMHGGVIRIESTPDVGTSFFFTIPIK